MPNATRKGATTTDEVIENYLKAPYARILMPERDGTFTAEILEFPGCLAQGATSSEALARLEEAARSWIGAALDQGQEIPPPTTNQGFSGRVALRLPRGLHRQAVRFAERDGTSLNQFLVTAIAARVGAEDICDKITQRWSHVVPQEAHIWFHQSSNIIFQAAPTPPPLVMGDMMILGKVLSWNTSPVELGAKTDA